jgi:hypothetical protein
MLDLKTSVRAYGNIEAKLLNDINGDQGSTSKRPFARTKAATSRPSS